MVRNVHNIELVLQQANTMEAWKKINIIHVISLVLATLSRMRYVCMKQ